MKRSVSATRLRPQRRRVDLEQQVDADLERLEAEDRRRAGEEAGDAGGRPVVGLERERLGVAEPAGQRLARLLVPALGDEEEGGRPWPAVEVFVAAADREIGAGGVQLDRHRAGAVGQIPQRERAALRAPRAVRRAMSCSRPLR